MLFKSIISLALIAVSASAQAVKGKAFDHIFIIFLENTDYDLAYSDPNLQAFFNQSLLLTNYHGVTHPSEPNYLAAVAGDYYGLNDDAYHAIPNNYTTIIDLLEPKGLTWKTYQEDMPATPCFDDYEYNGLYFRKHNPFIMHDNIRTNATRCAKIVPATQLNLDLNSTEPLPNYMFFTPNIINDGHNTTVKDASKWLSGFLPPLLNNTKFINNTLVVLTFDETDNYKTASNNVLTLLMGDVIKGDLKNTTDDTFYSHYSLLSTVESNWDLGNLGRNDVNPTLSNVFNFVAAATGYKNVNVTNPPLLNTTEPGFLAPVPSASATSAAGRSVALSSVLGAAAALVAGACAALI
ncbi:acid phosphatase [Dissophora ornata]|nr:hypothetical protein BGZ58_006133 [Dissophora ornata]KAI8595103.1 acid phosphatase [Dissophora ornata]